MPFTIQRQRTELWPKFFFFYQQRHQATMSLLCLYKRMFVWICCMWNNEAGYNAGTDFLCSKSFWLIYFCHALLKSSPDSSGAAASSLFSDQALTVYYLVWPWGCLGRQVRGIPRRECSTSGTQKLYLRDLLKGRVRGLDTGASVFC